MDNTVNGQGIVAIVSKPTYSMESISIEDGVYITLDGVQDPGNLGTIITYCCSGRCEGDIFNERILLIHIMTRLYVVQ